MDLFRSQWEVDVKRKARHVMRERKHNKTVELPDPSDIATLARHLQESMQAIKNPSTYEEFWRIQLQLLGQTDFIQ